VLFETYNGCIKENYSRLNELRVNDGGGSGRSCFEIKVRVDSAELTNMIIAGFGERCFWCEKVRCSSKAKPRLRAEWVVFSGELCISASCFLSLMRRNAVLEE